MKTYYKFFYDKDLWKAVNTIKEIFFIADRKWVGLCMKENEGRKEEMINFTSKASLKLPLIKMSLTFDIFRGNVKGTLDKDVDDALHVCHGEVTRTAT